MPAMTKSVATVGLTQGPAASVAARARANAQSAPAHGARHTLAEFADRVKTLLDRTLDAARGRYDL